MQQAEKVLKALANRRRLEIVKFLNERGKVSVGVIAKHIGLSFKSTSKHLHILRSADIIDREQISISMLYSLSKPFSKITESTLYYP